jgi:hypothetical protein
VAHPYFGGGKIIFLKNMLGIKKIAKGRMGNRLFHYHFLRQISKKTGIEYFCIDFPDAKKFDGMSKTGKVNFRFNKKIRLTSKDILSYQPDDFIEFVKSEDIKGRDIILDPPMLGEVFFDYLFFDPNEFIGIKKEHQKGFEFDVREKKIIALHFRGTDFEAWNKNASLKFDYYKKSIDYCLEYFKNEKIVFVLFTDDLNFQPYTNTVDYLKSKNLEYHLGDPKGSPIHDFYQMTQSDVLVSSPSTFAIFAGILGKKKKIIHAQSWMDYAIDNNDTFWSRLSETNNPYYKLWKAF